MEVFSDFGDRRARSLRGRRALAIYECREERLAKLIEGLFDGWFLTKVSFSPNIRCEHKVSLPPDPATNSRGFNHFELLKAALLYRWRYLLSGSRQFV